MDSAVDDPSARGLPTGENATTAAWTPNCSEVLAHGEEGGAALFEAIPAPLLVVYAANLFHHISRRRPVIGGTECWGFVRRGGE
jgi:hypothetical protein